MQKTTRFNLTYLIVAVIGVFVIHDLWVEYQSVTPLAYSEFQKLVGEGKVGEIFITEGEIRGELKDPQPPKGKLFRTTRVDSSLAEEQAPEGFGERGGDDLLAGGPGVSALHAEEAEVDDQLAVRLDPDGAGEGCISSARRTKAAKEAEEEGHAGLGHVDRKGVRSSAFDLHPLWRADEDNRVHYRYR